MVNIQFWTCSFFSVFLEITQQEWWMEFSVLIGRGLKSVESHLTLKLNKTESRKQWIIVSDGELKSWDFTYDIWKLIVQLLTLLVQSFSVSLLENALKGTFINQDNFKTLNLGWSRVFLTFPQGSLFIIHQGELW